MNRNRWLVRLGILAFGGSGILYILLTPMPRLPVKVANGFYGNPCCGELRLFNGKISFGDKTDKFVIEKDKAGAYVLPSHYVGVLDGHTVEFDSTKRSLMLRLDDLQRPRKIEMLGRDGEIYTFFRRGS